MSEEKKPTEPPKPTNILNEDALKGIWVDGIGFHITKDYTILEGVVSKPRVETPTIATRIIFPSRILESLVKKLSEVIALQKAKEQEESQKKQEKSE